MKVSDEDPFYDYKTLDVAGQSVWHHIVGAINRKGGYGRLYLALLHFRRADDKANEDSEIFTARCNKQTPLHRAASTGHPFIIDELLGTDPNANAADNFGRTALCLAAHDGNSYVVNVLCDKMTPIGRDRMDSNARNALHYAVLNQNEEAALSLIKRGIDINVLDHLGRPPVLYAAMNHMERVVESLLKKSNIDLSILPRYEANKPSINITRKGRACQKRFGSLADMIRERRKAQVERERDFEDLKASYFAAFRDVAIRLNIKMPNGSLTWEIPEDSGRGRKRARGERDESGTESGQDSDHENFQDPADLSENDIPDEGYMWRSPGKIGSSASRRARVEREEGEGKSGQDSDFEAFQNLAGRLGARMPNGRLTWRSPRIPDSSNSSPELEVKDRMEVLFDEDHPPYY